MYVNIYELKISLIKMNKRKCRLCMFIKMFLVLSIFKYF